MIDKLNEETLTLEDIESVRQFQQCDNRIGFDQLVVKYQKMIFNLCFNILSDYEEDADMTQDTFVGGSETTTNALSAGIMLLARNKPVWEKLKADPDKYLKTFCEEVVRMEGPVQGLTRMANKDVELHGVKIPKGGLVMVRFGAANRDPAVFECPNDIDLERKNAGSHLGFSSGTHHCLGAPLARRELYWGFKAFIDRVDDFWLAEGKNDLRHLPNYGLRILKELHIEFVKK